MQFPSFVASSTRSTKSSLLILFPKGKEPEKTCPRLPFWKYGGMDEVKKCPICGKDVPRRYRKDREDVYCSRACMQQGYAQAWINKPCPVCGKVFRSRKVVGQTFCSHACSTTAQKGRKITSEAFAEACRHRGVPGPRKHPKTGKFETNCLAKIWHLESPEGEEITVRNLKLYMVSRFGEKEGGKVYNLLTLAVKRFRKNGYGTGGGWRLLSLPTLPEE